MSLGDVWLYGALEFALTAFPDIMELTPWVKEFVAKVRANENLSKYLDSRPASALGI